MMTTLNIDSDVLYTISIHASRKKQSKSKLIIWLIKRLMNECECAPKPGSPIRYQIKRDNGYWQVFHIRLNDCDYEFFLDLRKVLKLSVSRILALAVEKYLGEEIEYVDKYLFDGYSIEVYEYAYGRIWRIKWKKPKPNKKKLNSNDTQI